MTMDNTKLVNTVEIRINYDPLFHARSTAAWMIAKAVAKERKLDDDTALSLAAALGVLLSDLDPQTGEPLATVFEQLEAHGVNKARLDAVLDSGDNFGDLVNAFEVLTVLNTVQDAWRIHLANQPPKETQTP